MDRDYGFCSLPSNDFCEMVDDVTCYRKLGAFRDDWYISKTAIWNVVWTGSDGKENIEKCISFLLK